MITDTDLAGRVTVSWRCVAGLELVSTIKREVRVFTSARVAGRAPRTVMVVVKEVVGLVFTALIKMVLPVRVAVASM